MRANCARVAVGFAVRLRARMRKASLSSPLRPALLAVAVTTALALLIVFGSRKLAHFDAALVGYTIATLFAAFGITYRYAVWLQRPPTHMYWRRGWQAFFAPRFLATNVVGLLRRALVEVAAN